MYQTWPPWTRPGMETARRSCRTLIRRRQPLFREVAELIKLLNFHHACVLHSLAHHAGVPVKPLCIVHDKIHAKNGQ